MKKIIIIGFGVVVGLMMSACSDSAEGIASNYVEAWASGNLEEIYELSDMDAKESIEQAVSRCEMKNTKGKRQKINNTNRALTKEFAAAVREIKQNHPEFNKVNTEQANDLLDEFTEAIKDHFDDHKHKEFFISLTEIATNGASGEANKKKMIVILEKIYNKENKEKTDKIHKECVLKLVSIKNYKDVNVLEVKEVDADEIVASIEVVYADGKTQKSAINIDLVNKEWKVVGSRFINAIDNRNIFY